MRILPDWLDHESTLDPTLLDDQALVSKRFKAMARPLAQSVLILSHGFSASMAEWEEFTAYTKAKRPDILISKVVMGAHGRHLAVFKTSTWQMWGAPILNEYRQLCQQGYRRIYLGVTSMSAGLILYYLLSQQLTPIPAHLFLIDPFLNAKCAWGLKTVDYWGPLLKQLNWARGRTESERRQHYNCIPYACMQQINQFCHVLTPYVRRSFSPLRIDMTLLLASHDSIVSTKATRYFCEKNPTVTCHFFDSQHHVFTRLKGRKGVRQSDQTNQKRAFACMLSKIVRG